MSRLWAPLLAIGCVACSQAQTTLTVGPVFGQEFLGSEDTRRGGFYGFGRLLDGKRLAIRGWEPDLEATAYYMFTKGGGFEDIPVDQMRSYGLMGVARYPLRWADNVDMYMSLGFGVVYNTITTRDLDSNFNTTPLVGLGVRFDRTFLEFRIYHQSNGGTSGNNQGQNQFQFLTGWRF